jgi:hypothetical protein
MLSSEDVKMKTVFDKLRDFKVVVKAILPRLSDRELELMVDHITRMDEGVRKGLNQSENVLQDIMLRHGYNPRTVLSWLRIMTYPRFLKEQLKSGELSVVKAKKVYRDYKVKTNDQIEKEIIVMVREYVNNLPLKEFIGGELNG